MQGVTHTFDYVRRLIVAPIGDIQDNGNPDRVTDALQRHLARLTALAARGEHVRYIGMGDYIDFASPSNRTKLQRADVYDNAREVIDNAARVLTTNLSATLQPTAGRWLGMLSGHHYYDFLDGSSSDEMLAGLLDTEHLGDSAYVRLHFRFGTHTGSVVIWAHHGAGNGASKAYGIQKLEKRVQPEFEADAYLMGHTTGLAVQKIPRVYPVFSGDRFTLRHKTLVLMNTGGWAKSYIPENQYGKRRRGDYAERGMLPPAALGAPLLVITARPTSEGVVFNMEGVC